MIGREARAQILELAGRLPDAIVACVGGGSNAMGIFDAFIDDRGVRLIGVEAGGEQIARGRHAARFAGGSAGVLQGTRTFVLQDDDGNIELTHSISAGLDYAAVGPEHAWLRAHRPRRVRARHRRRGARRVSDAGAARGHPAGARVGARRSRTRRRSPRELGPVGDHAREPVGPRRQGRAHGGEARCGAGAAGCAVTRLASPRRSRAFARERQAGPRHLHDGRRSRSAALGRDSAGARSRRRRRARGRRAVLRSAGRRPGDPAGDRAGARGRRQPAGDARAGRADPPVGRGADRALQLREPAPAHGRWRRSRGGRPRAGVDGVLALDLPIEEAGEFRETLAAAGLDTIFLLSPTTTDARIRKAAALGRGFLYGISRLGVTGARDRVAVGRRGARPADPRAHRRCRSRSASASRGPSTSPRSAPTPTPPWSAARWCRSIAERGRVAGARRHGSRPTCAR